MTMARRRKITRRTFLKGAATAGAAATFPAIIPSTALGADGAVAPSNRITVGIIGTGDHGTKVDIAGFLYQKDAQIVALCDVDRVRYTEANKVVVGTYGERYPGFKGCDTTQDWREIVARDDLDAVAVATPDHWHVLCAKAAIESGKDVLCEKPLSLTVEEGRALSDAAKKHNRVSITASENRSRKNFLRVAELVRNGRIGKVHTIRTELPQGRWIPGKLWATDIGGGFAGKAPEYPPVPETLDYDMWLGQAAKTPYTPGHLHWNWRWLLKYSGGMLTDWGAHMNDIAQWGNGTDTTGPVSVEGSGKFPVDLAGYNTATEWELTYEYRNGVTLICSSGRRSGHVRFEGSDGWVQCLFFGKVEASSDEILNSEIGADGLRLRTCPGGEHRDFLDCIKSREDTYAPFEVGHRTITISHIGNIALKLGRKLQWDPDNERFVNDTEADSHLSREMQNGWHL